jgi:Na+-driven multidrug efflux pump
MVCLEWWAYQLMTLMSGSFGVSAQAAQVVLGNISGILFMVSLGCQQASGTLIGQEIGKNEVTSAKEYFKVTKNVSFVIISATTVFVMAFYENLMDLFLHSDESNDFDIQ